MPLKTLAKRLLTREIILYLLVGVLGAVVDFGSFYYLKNVLRPLYAQWLASFLGFSHNHLWQHYQVFEHNQSLERTYAVSLVISLLSVAVSGPALLALLSLGWNVWLAKLTVLALTTIILYVIRKKFVFFYSAE